MHKESVLEYSIRMVEGFISLTRWKEHLPLVSLTLLGGLVAHGVHGVTLEWRLLVVMLANYLTVAFAFMVNDMEDADDDAKNPISARRNPITNGSLDMRSAWAACVLVVSAAMLLFSVGGPYVVLVGTINLIISLLYSWKPVRLKSSSVGLDVVSHTLMLGGLLPLAGYFVYSAELHPAIILIAAATTLGSTYGQLYNQIRDFDADRDAGIMNVTIRLGRRTTWVLAYAAVLLTTAFGAIAFTQMTFPNWLVYVVAASTIIGTGSMLLMNNVTDASGKPALDVTGRLQLGVWFALTISVLAWTMHAMGAF